VKRGKEGKICGADDGDDMMEKTTMEKMTTKKSIPNLLSAHPRAEKAPEPIPHASWEQGCAISAMVRTL
jgi:hypothetical protein